MRPSSNNSIVASYCYISCFKLPLSRHVRRRLVQLRAGAQQQQQWQKRIIWRQASRPPAQGIPPPAAQRWRPVLLSTACHRQLTLYRIQPPLPRRLRMSWKSSSIPMTLPSPRCPVEPPHTPTSTMLSRRSFSKSRSAGRGEKSTREVGTGRP